MIYDEDQILNNYTVDNLNKFGKLWTFMKISNWYKFEKLKVMKYILRER